MKKLVILIRKNWKLTTVVAANVFVLSAISVSLAQTGGLNLGLIGVGNPLTQTNVNPDGSTTTTAPDGSTTTTAPGSPSASQTPSPTSSARTPSSSSSPAFSAKITGSVLTFEGTATGEITLSLSGTMATYSRGGVSAATIDIASATKTTVGSGQTLNLTAIQVNGLSEALSIIDGPGNVIVRDMHAAPMVWLSELRNTGTKTASWNGNAVLNGNLGSFTTTVASGATLTGPATLLSGAIVVGEGNVQITGIDQAPSVNLSGISNSGNKSATITAYKAFNRDANFGNVTINIARGISMNIFAPTASNATIVGNGNVHVFGVKDVANVDFRKISAVLSVEFGQTRPSGITGNLGNARIVSPMTGDTISFVGNSVPEADSASVNASGEWHYDSYRGFLTYCVDGQVFTLTALFNMTITHANNAFSIAF